MSKDYVFDAVFADVLPNGFILFELDLGFGIKNKRPFKPFLPSNVFLYDEAWDAMLSWMTEAEEILIKSIPKSPGQYCADISFLREGKWYNVFKLLQEQNLIWTGTRDASN